MMVESDLDFKLDGSQFKDEILSTLLLVLQKIGKDKALPSMKTLTHIQDLESSST